MEDGGRWQMRSIVVFTSILLVVNAINNSTVRVPSTSRSSFTTSTSSKTTSSDNNESTKDQRLFDLLESLMVTIHDKLRRAESLESSCRTMLTTMSKRLDALDSKFEENGDRSEAALAKLRSIDSRIVKEDMGGSQLLRDLVTKVNTLSDQLSELKNHVLHEETVDVGGHVSLQDDGEILSAMGSEHRTIVTDKAGHSVVTVLSDSQKDPKVSARAQQTPPKKDIVHPWETTSDVSHGLAYLKERFSDLDTRLQGWMSQVDAKANTIADSVNDLHDALMDPRGLDEVLEETPINGPGPPNLRGILRSGRTTTTTTTTTTTATPLPAIHRNTSTNGSSTGFGALSRRSTKLDKLIQRIRPILRVGEQMDELWTVVLGTQRSVDDSLQKSDQLLTNSYRQVQTLSDVKNYLHHQTSRIMANLEQVEEWLREQTAASPTTLDPKVVPINLRDLIERADLQNDDIVLEDMDDFVLPEDAPVKLTEIGGGAAVERRLLRLREGDYARKTQSLEPKVRVVKLPITAAAASASSSVNANKKNSTSANVTSASNSSTSAGPKDTCPYQETSSINCADLRSRGVTTSGVYYILIKGTTYWFMKVYCDMEVAGGGWTAIQRRGDFGVQKENFIRDWTDYKNGFGDLRKEFWLGNENIFMLTNQDDYTLRVELEDFDGNKRFAMYTKFKLYSEAENYKLEIGGYEGNAGDSFNDPWYGSNLNPFSTYDRDNDRSSLNCASMLRGGWWWRSCGRGLNGIYLTDPTDLAARQGIVWFRWRGWDYTLKKASMLIRPKTFTPPKNG